jgi:hypothetical protein
MGAAPGARQEGPALKNHEYAVTVSGCLKGKRLERAVIQSAPDSLPPDALRAAGFALEGPKELIREIEGHKNHTDHITGVLTVPPNLARALTRRVGKIDIGIGTPGMNRMQDAQQVLKLRVTSFVHLQDRCAGK